MKGLASLADVQNLELEPHRLPASTYEMLGDAARTWPSSPALSFLQRADQPLPLQTWSYQTLFERITATANLLHELGVGSTEVVAIVLPNLPQTHLAIWGAQATGIAFPINPMLDATAIAGLLAASAAKVLITESPTSDDAGLWRKLQPLLDRVCSLRHVLLVDPASQVSPVKHAVAEGSGHPEVHDFEDCMRQQPPDRLLSGRVIQPGDKSSFFCTGGTTGAPRIAMRTHANEVANAWSTAQFLGDGISAGKTIFCGLPLFHVNGVLVTGLLPFSRGAHVIVGTPLGFRGEGVISRFWEIVERHRINFFSAVPTVYSALMQVPTAGFKLDSLQYGLCGAAPLPAELMRSFQASTGLAILEGYGLTEGTCVSTCNPPLGERRNGSIGLRLPLQDMKAVVLDDKGTYVRDCEVAESGLLTISGPNVFAGYLDSGHGEGLWLELNDGRRWLNTGDLGWQDADGYFYLTGRKKELIIRGGHNIDPASIEEPLHRHPAVQLAAAVSRPDPHLGEVPVAYVQLKPGFRATEDELLSFVRSRITERAAVPKAIRLVAAMPLTGVGKIYKPELRQRETADALRTGLLNAGATISGLDVSQSARFGVLIKVSVPDCHSADIARETLGRFPFQFEVSCAK